MLCYVCIFACILFKYRCYMYIYIHIIHLYTHTHIYIYIYVYIHIHLHIHIHIDIWMMKWRFTAGFQHPCYGHVSCRTSGRTTCWWINWWWISKAFKGVGGLLYLASSNMADHGRENGETPHKRRFFNGKTTEKRWNGGVALAGLSIGVYSKQ